MDVVSLLLERKADVNGKTLCGDSTLSIAVQCEQEQVVQLLLEHKAALGHAMMCGNTTKRLATPMLVPAVLSGSVRMVQLLLAAKCNPNEKSPNAGSGALGYALCGEARNTPKPVLSTVRLLLNAKADPNSKDVDGTRPLHLACRRKLPACVAALVEHKANPQLKSGVDLYPADEAVEGNSLECACRAWLCAGPS
jgi:ankyrin repeat protein